MTGLPPKPADWPDDWPDDVVAAALEDIHPMARLLLSDPPNELNAKCWQELRAAVRRRLAQRNGHAQPSVPPSANPAYVKAVVSRELARLEAEPPNSRNDTLNKVTLRCARVLPFDAATRESLRRELIAACDRNGLNADDGVHDTESTINSAFRAADRDGPAAVPERKTPAANVTVVDSLPGTNSWTPPTGDAQSDHQAAGDAEPTTWEPVDLGPYLRGEIQRPTPTIGITRADGLRFLYPAREHVVVGETESGKTWFALCCVARELHAGNRVLYIHYEEGDATSTIERLQLLGIADSVIAEQFRFVAPIKPVQPDWLAELLTPAATLVVHDGVNEAMSLIGAEIKDVDGAAQFRRRLIRPCLDTGAATLACDHMPMVRDGTRRDAYGSVHKGNALDGARIALENAAPFGRGLRGASHVFVTKDRPGHLRARGRATKTPGKTYMGTFVVDDSRTFEPFETAFYAPRDDDDATPMTDEASRLAENVWQVIDAQPEHTVGSLRDLYTQMRHASHTVDEKRIRDAVDDLVAGNRLAEFSGKRGALGYRTTAVATAVEVGENDHPRD